MTELDAGQLADAGEQSYRYGGALSVGEVTQRVGLDHTVVVMCDSLRPRRTRLIARFGARKRRVRCPLCHRWAVMELAEEAPVG